MGIFWHFLQAFYNNLFFFELLTFLFSLNGKYLQMVYGFPLLALCYLQNAMLTQCIAHTVSRIHKEVLLALVNGSSS